MANQPKETAEVTITDTTVNELKQTVDALPRTDFMTLPAVNIVTIDDETLRQMEMTRRMNAGGNPDDVVNDQNGITRQQYRDMIEFGVMPDGSVPEGSGKHTFDVNTAADGSVESVTINPPEEGGQSVEIAAAPANVAPMDADQPTNPVEARENRTNDATANPPAPTPMAKKTTASEADRNAITTPNPNENPNQ